MQSIKQIQRLNETELASAVPASASWHTDYRDTAYIYIGGLPLDLSEGDVITIFSQYGEPVWIRLARDKDTGKSKGFAWLKYEDQRSCDLAVDNMSGAKVMDRLLAVDHARYQKRENEDEMEGYVGQDKQIESSGGDTKKRRTHDVSEEESEEEKRPMIKEEVELAKLLQDHDDDDPMKAYMVQQKKEEVEEALKAASKPRKKDDRHRHGTYKSRHHDEDHRDRLHRPRRSRSKDNRDDRRERHRSTRDRSRSPRHGKRSDSYERR